MRKIIFASNNEAKIKEVRAILGERFDIKSMKEVGLDLLIEETGTTFEENANIKARTVYDVLKMPVIADDSGLEVEFLKGEPGVNTASYCEYGNAEKNNQKLINNLKGVYNRDAKFVCVIVYIDEKGESHIVREYTEGRILHEEAGTNGFAYDPIFYSYELEKTFGQASEKEKNQVSHRAKALIKLYRRVLCQA